MTPWWWVAVPLELGFSSTVGIIFTTAAGSCSRFSEEECSIYLGDQEARRGQLRQINFFPGQYRARQKRNQWRCRGRRAISLHLRGRPGGITAPSSAAIPARRWSATQSRISAVSLSRRNPARRGAPWACVHYTSYMVFSGRSIPVLAGLFAPLPRDSLASGDKGPESRISGPRSRPQDIFGRTSSAALSDLTWFYDMWRRLEQRKTHRPNYTGTTVPGPPGRQTARPRPN